MPIQFILCIFLLQVNSLFAATQSVWSVNSWGNTAPTTTYLDNNQNCQTKNYQPSSFLIKARGNGDAELVFHDKLTSNNAYNFSVGLSSNKKTSVSVFFRRDDFPYETTSIQQFEISDRKLINLKGIYTANGKGSVRIALADTDATLCIDSPNLSTITHTTVGTQSANQLEAKQHLINENFFGVHINKLGKHNNWPSFNPGTIRLWDTGTTWSDIQPNPKSVSWDTNAYAKRLDFYINHAKKNNKNIQFIYTLAMTPEWAGAKNKTNCNHSSYGSSSCMAPINLEDWRQYIKKLGNRYKGTIKIWELWNEADQPSFWQGSPEDMAQMAKIASAELKKIDPNNQIIGPNITILGFSFLSKFLKAGGGDVVDGFSIHAYVGRSPELSLDVIRNMQQLLIDGGYNKPIWNTETNVSCNSTLEDCKPINNNNPSIVTGENALAQGMLGNAALGVKNFSYYTVEGASLKDGGLGLVQSDFKTATKAGIVYANIKSWLVGAQVAYLQSGSNDINIIKIERFGQQAFALWSFKGNQTFNLDTLPEVHILKSASGQNALIKTSSIDIGQEPVLVFPKSFKFD